jgi:hypothetical protein
MHKRQKAQTSDIVVSCVYLTFDEVSTRENYYLLQFDNNERFILSPFWDKLIHVADTDCVLSKFNKTVIVIKDAFSVVSFEKLQNASFVLSKNALNSLLRLLIISNLVYTKEYYHSWFVLGVSFEQVLQPIIDHYFIEPIRGEEFLKRLHYASIYTLPSVDRICLCTFICLKHFKWQQQGAIQLTQQWSLVKEILVWKGLYSETDHPCLSKLFGMERKIVNLLLCATRKSGNVLFNNLPIDILRYHLLPLLYWSLPFKTPFCL